MNRHILVSNCAVGNQLPVCEKRKNDASIDREDVKKYKLTYGERPVEKKFDSTPKENSTESQSLNYAASPNAIPDERGRLIEFIENSLRTFYHRINQDDLIAVKNLLGSSKYNDYDQKRFSIAIDIIRGADGSLSKVLPLSEPTGAKNRGSAKGEIGNAKKNSGNDNNKLNIKEHLFGHSAHNDVSEYSFREFVAALSMGNDLYENPENWLHYFPLGQLGQNVSWSHKDVKSINAFFVNQGSSSGSWGEKMVEIYRKFYALDLSRDPGGSDSCRLSNCVPPLRNILSQLLTRMAAIDSIGEVFSQLAKEHHLPGFKNYYSRACFPSPIDEINDHSRSSFLTQLAHQKIPYSRQIYYLPAEKKICDAVINWSSVHEFFSDPDFLWRDLTIGQIGELNRLEAGLQICNYLLGVRNSNEKNVFWRFQNDSVDVIQTEYGCSLPARDSQNLKFIDREIRLTDCSGNDFFPNELPFLDEQQAEFIRLLNSDQWLQKVKSVMSSYGFGEAEYEQYVLSLRRLHTHLENLPAKCLIKQSDWGNQEVIRAFFKQDTLLKRHASFWGSLKDRAALMSGVLPTENGETCLEIPAFLDGLPTEPIENFSKLRLGEVFDRFSAFPAWLETNRTAVKKWLLPLTKPLSPTDLRLLKQARTGFPALGANFYFCNLLREPPSTANLSHLAEIYAKLQSTEPLTDVERGIISSLFPWSYWGAWMAIPESRKNWFTSAIASTRQIKGELTMEVKVDNELLSIRKLPPIIYDMCLYNPVLAAQNLINAVHKQSILLGQYWYQLHDYGQRGLSTVYEIGNIELEEFAIGEDTDRYYLKFVDKKIDPSEINASLIQAWSITGINGLELFRAANYGLPIVNPQQKKKNALFAQLLTADMISRNCISYEIAQLLMNGVFGRNNESDGAKDPPFVWCCAVRDSRDNLGLLMEKAPGGPFFQEICNHWQEFTFGRLGDLTREKTWQMLINAILGQRDNHPGNNSLSLDPWCKLTGYDNDACLPAQDDIREGNQEASNAPLNQMYYFSTASCDVDCYSFPVVDWEMFNAIELISQAENLAKIREIFCRWGRNPEWSGCNLQAFRNLCSRLYNIKVVLQGLKATHSVIEPNLWGAPETFYKILSNENWMLHAFFPVDFSFLNCYDLHNLEMSLVPELWSWVQKKQKMNPYEFMKVSLGNVFNWENYAKRVIKNIEKTTALSPHEKNKIIHHLQKNTSSQPKPFRCHFLESWPIKYVNLIDTFDSKKLRFDPDAVYKFRDFGDENIIYLQKGTAFNSQRME